MAQYRVLRDVKVYESGLSLTDSVISDKYITLKKDEIIEGESRAMPTGYGLRTNIYFSRHGKRYKVGERYVNAIVNKDSRRIVILSLGLSAVIIGGIYFLKR